MAKVLFIIVFLGLLLTVESANEDDLITSLPGVNFNYNFKQYSGYLNAGNGGKWKFFYWLTESQTGSSDNDPLIVWFNGGPGCSSVGGMFEELGPFYVDADKKTLYENIFAWNKYANLLAIESPIGVGFSYSTDDPKNYTVGDDTTASQNLAALSDFFANVQSKYANRTWFIAGESYAGIYIPTVTKLVLQSIQNNTFPNKNFGGIAIGNGYMNIQLLTNTLVLWANYHGIIGVTDWDELKEICCENVTDIDNCDFTAGFDYVYMNGSTSPCGENVLRFLNITSSSAISSLADPYNFYQDCYKANYLTDTQKFIHKGLLGTGNAVKSASQLNYDSTDNQFSFPCYNGDSATAYLNQPEVQKAFHVNDSWIKSNGKWQDCNDDLNSNYPVKYTDTKDVFNEIIKIVTNDNIYVPGFRILIYNGDVDTVCNFLGDARHINNIAGDNGFKYTSRYAWIFRNQLAGYQQTYSLPYKNNNTLYIDVLTVKGSGHFVPNDRQGPSNQMIYNFIKRTGNYNNTDGFLDSPTPLSDISLSTITKPSYGVMSILLLFFFFLY